MDDGAFDVYKYNIKELEKVLIKWSDIDNKLLSKTIHLKYFEDYFNNIGAKTIVVERKYVDKDYLEDFAAYYVRCFHPYDRFCARLHFFDKEIKDNNDFKSLISKPDDEKVNYPPTAEPMGWASGIN